jgi:hypothetical protein
MFKDRLVCRPCLVFRGAADDVRIDDRFDLAPMPPRQVLDFAVMGG